MAVTFLININEDEFKVFLKQALSELLQEGLTLNSTTQTNEQEIMTIKEASVYLRLKVQTIYEKTSLKLIPHFKKGKKLYFNKKELQEWLATGKIKTKSEFESNASTYTLQNHLKKLRK